MRIKFLSRRTKSGLRLDFLRMIARLRNRFFRKKNISPKYDNLHFGCGDRIVPGWVNTDVHGSPFDLDLCSPLPWKKESFTVIVGQQVIEHLELERELIPFLKEINRIAKTGAQLWLSTPDMAKVCHSYIEDKGKALHQDRLARWPVNMPDGIPTQQMINVLFHQGGQHKNLFDYELLRWVLEHCGFYEVERTSEVEFLETNPEFASRNDDYHSVYIKCIKK